jgi:cAMP-specific phosphodiesterase 4/high affinity cAMP-specific and IBMX-insensitive 3',5'-cyclic phosphodiesterase 8
MNTGLSVMPAVDSTSQGADHRDARDDFFRIHSVKWEHPPSFNCPISGQVMHDPVLLCDGHTYEKRHIERWLFVEKRTTSPMTNVELEHKMIFPNIAFRNVIEEYQKQVFNVHRHDICKTIESGSQQSLDSNEPFLKSIDALTKCSFLMNADLDIECALRQIMDEARNLLGAEAASVFLVDAAKQELYSHVNSTGGELRISMTAGIAGHCATTGEALVIDNAYDDERFNKANDVKTGFRTSNMMCVPLKLKKGVVIGVVQLINKSASGVFSHSEASLKDDARPSFTAQDLRFLQVFASQAATAVANSEATLQEIGMPTTPTSSQRIDSQEYWTMVDHDEKSSVDVSPKHTAKQTTITQQFTIDNGCDEERGGAKGTLEYEYERSWIVRDDELVKPMTRRASKKRSRSAASSKNAATKAKAIAFALEEASKGWQFDACAFAKLTGNRPLSTLGPYLMTQSGVVKALDLDIEKVNNFFAVLERGYDDANPFHNRAHAALKLHTMYALLQHGGISTAISSESRDVASSVNDLEKLACLLAAAMRDHEHIALTNEFLVQVGHSRAVLYNDKQVNEHHHVASGFAVLNKDECNCMSNLTRDQFAYVRSLVIELVLATSSGIDCTNEPSQPIEDIIHLLQHTMKCVDICYAAQRLDVYSMWIDNLESEYFKQGDRQKELGHPVSNYMDRDRPGWASLKLEFLNSSALPLLDRLVEVAPGAQPMKDAVVANCRSLDARLDVTRNAKSRSKSRPRFQKDDQRHRQSVDSYSMVATSSEESKKKKTSGRTRQRRAKFYASVRQRTPSPEVGSSYTQYWDTAQFN